MSQNKSTQQAEFPLNGRTNLKEDRCSQTASEKQEQEMFQYRVSNFRTKECEAPKVSQLAYSQPTLYFRDGFGTTAMDGCNVDSENDIKLNENKLTNLKVIQQLNPRKFLTTRSTRKGEFVVNDESKLKLGGYNFMNEKQLKNTKIAEHMFTPLLPEMKEFIHNNQEYIEDMNRMGNPSRITTKNSLYDSHKKYKNCRM